MSTRLLCIAVLCLVVYSLAVLPCPISVLIAYNRGVGFQEAVLAADESSRASSSSPRSEVLLCLEKRVKRLSIACVRRQETEDSLARGLRAPHTVLSTQCSTGVLDKHSIKRTLEIKSLPTCSDA